MRVHIFHSSAEGYDYSQQFGAIRDNDILLVPSENIKGFMFKAWPVAISPEYGEFHTAEDIEGPYWDAHRLVISLAKGERPEFLDLKNDWVYDWRNGIPDQVLQEI